MPPSTKHPIFDPRTLNTTDLTSLTQFTAVVIDILESAVFTLRQRTYRTRYGMKMVQEAEQFIDAWKRTTNPNYQGDITDDDLEL